MKGKMLKRRIIGWMVTLVMVLTMVNIPLFSAEVRAEGELTVTFNANGGEGTMEPQIYTPGAEQPLNGNVFKRTGYIFKGWSTNAEGTTVEYNDKQSIKDRTLMLYAVWEEHKNHYYGEYVKSNDAMDGKAGNYEYYMCECGQKQDKYKGVHDDAYYIMPYVKDSIDITLGTSKEKDSYILDGMDGVDSITVTDAKDYEKYFSLNEETGEITTKKYYKKEIENPVITVMDKHGEPHDVVVNLTIAKPTTKQINVKRKKIADNNYQYTITYNKKGADKLLLTVAKGSVSDSNRKILNSYFKKNMKKSKGKIIFNIYKSAIKKKKLTFEGVAQYGKNKSQTVKITR